MSGDFDHPPASDTASASLPSIPARLQNIRQTLQREREQDRLSWDHAAAGRARDSRDMPPTTRSASFRGPYGPRGAPSPFRNGRRAAMADEITSTLGRRQRPPPRESQPISRARRGLSSREQYANLHPHLERHPASTSERLEHINSSLTNLLDPSSFHQATLPNLDAYLDHDRSDGEDERQQRRQKRRKLDYDNNLRGRYANIQYGHYGQVVAGQLKLKLVSCDGGQLRDHNPALHCPENVLRTDMSVYCTERPQCNLLFEHLDDTTFSLEKLVIKGPDKGFTAPVQEGLVFVSTSTRALTSSASQYAIRYRPSSPPYVPRHRPRTPESRRYRDRDREQGGLTLLEAINDDAMWEASQHRQRTRSFSSDDDGANQPRTPDHQDENETAWVTADQILSASFENGDHDHPPVLSPQDFRAPTPPSFLPQICITTSTDDPSLSLMEQEEDSTAADILADRVIRESRMRGATASSSAFHEDFDNTVAGARFGAANDNEDLLPPIESVWPDAQLQPQQRQRGGGSNSPYGRRPHPAPTGRDRWAPRRYPVPAPPGFLSLQRRSRPSRIEARPHAEAMMGAEGELLEPTARFFIPDDKSAIAVKFDPPICGRWICVRLFSPVLGGNIDVQSVVAYGYAGQRFFPACSPV